MVETLLHLALLLIASPALLGIINRVKAICAGRQGPPLLQPYYDLAKLLRKDLVLSKTTSWVFIAGPAISLAAIILAGILTPMGTTPAPLSFTGDIILLVYLFGLSRFLTASAALDTGSAFEGMGAAREVTFSCFAEPALFFGFAALARLSHSLSLSGIFAGLDAGPNYALIAPALLIAASWFIVLLAENCRIPFDDPNTHLELTMIHEVMVLDHSGPLFGLILYGAALKLFITSALLSTLLIAPFKIGGLEGLGIFVLCQIAVAIAVGLVESTMARLRLTSVPKLLVGACMLSGFGALLVMR